MTSLPPLPVLQVAQPDVAARFTGRNSLRKGIGSRTPNSHCEALLQQDHLPEQVEAGSAVDAAS